jgi:hypothetical protein
LHEVLSFKAASKTGVEEPAPKLSPPDASVEPEDRPALAQAPTKLSEGAPIAQGGAKLPDLYAPAQLAALPSVVAGVEAKPPVAAAAEAKPAAPDPAEPRRDPVASLPPTPAPRERGLGEAAKIEARLNELESLAKDRASDARARVEAENAETHTLEKITELGALVTRLTGQLKDLEDEMRTLSAGSEEKFADLTRRVALGEANRSVTSAEAASASPPAPSQDKSEASGPKPEKTPMKVAGADAKRSYRIQAASPGLAMLSTTDGGADERPLQVEIGTDVPGYGKVRSIEQHGEAWVVKAERGAIQ